MAGSAWERVVFLLLLVLEDARVQAVKSSHRHRLTKPLFSSVSGPSVLGLFPSPLLS